MANYNDLQDKLRQDALTAAAAQSPGQAPTYAGTYDSQVEDLFNRIQNREDFSYDVNADPLYQQYKDKYVTQGKLAMRDTMGKAAGLTGGYGSTYSAQVGQQTYDSYLQNLSDAIPELYGMAYNKYQDEGNALQTQYGLAGQMRDTEYGQYRDALSDFNYNQQVARDLEAQEYNRQQQAYANIVALIRASGYQPTDAELAAAGLTRSAANALRTDYLRANGLLPVTASSGGGGGGVGSSKKKSSGSTTVDPGAAIQGAKDALNSGAISTTQFNQIVTQAMSTMGQATGLASSAVAANAAKKAKKSTGGGGRAVMVKK